MCNFKLTNENLNKIMYDQQANVNKVSIEIVFVILKNSCRILYYINVCVDRAFKIVMACCVFHKHFLMNCDKFLHITLVFQSIGASIF